MRLLLVEDDSIIGDGIVIWLSESGYAVDWLQDGTKVINAIETQNYDLLILDINLPVRSGLEILKELRSSNDNIPILLLTARDSVKDRVIGLDSGADDYLIKPFNMHELSARIRVLQRRHHGHKNPQIIHKGIIMNPGSYTVIKEDKLINLPNREFTLLQFLLENCGKVLSKNRIENNLYAWNEEVCSNAVEVHIHNIRKKFGNDLIRTIRGVGYIIEK